MMSLVWKKLNTVEEFESILDNSQERPALIFKHQPTSPTSVQVKSRMELGWNLKADQLDLYLVDDSKNPELSKHISKFAGVNNEFPQVLLFADGVTMYDESHEMINIKKIGIALKIINRTFKWMESRA